MEYIPPRTTFLNEHLIYDVSQLDEISGKSYLYYIRLTAHVMSPGFERMVLLTDMEKRKTNPILNTCREQCNIPNSVRDDINSGKAKLVLDYSAEGYWDIDWNWVSKIIEIDEDKIIWLTGIYNHKECDVGVNYPYKVTINKTSAKVKYNFLWERIVYGLISGYFEEIEKQLSLIGSLHKRPLMCISYNRRPHLHRIALLSKLLYHNELDNMIWSWGGILGDGGGMGGDFTDYVARQQEIKDFSSSWGKFLHQKYRDSYDTILQSPVHADVTEDISINQAANTNFSHVHNTYYQIITETFFAEPGVFLSEKSYKPFLACQPFVLCGQHHTVDVLRQQGYDVYDKWINHEYDTILDNKDRMSVLMKEVLRLNSLSHEEWTKMLKEMLPTIKKNLKHLIDSGSKKDVLSFDYSEKVENPTMPNLNA